MITEPNATIGAIHVRLRYFAALREAIGRSEETITTQAATAEELLKELLPRLGQKTSWSHAKVAVNDRIVSWATPLSDGDSVAFLTPFGGG